MSEDGNTFGIVIAAILAIAVVAVVVIACFGIQYDAGGFNTSYNDSFKDYSGDQKPAKYNTIKEKMNTANGAVWKRSGNNIQIDYSVMGFDSGVDYALRVYSNHHERLIGEIAVTKTNGKDTISVKDYPEGTYWINLIQYDDTMGCEPERCSLLLDIIRVDLGTPSSDADEYEEFLSGAIQRDTQHKVKAGAAWQNR